MADQAKQLLLACNQQSQVINNGAAEVRLMSAESKRPCGLSNHQTDQIVWGSAIWISDWELGTSTVFECLCFPALWGQLCMQDKLSQLSDGVFQEVGADSEDYDVVS